MTSSILRGLGNSKTPLIFVAVACLINIILDIIFIKGFRMGAAGAALATVIAQAGSLLFSVIYLKKEEWAFILPAMIYGYTAKTCIFAAKI